MKATITLLLTILFVSNTNAQAPAIEWQKSFGGSGRDRATSIQPTDDGGYIVAGTSDSNNGDVTGNHGGADYWVVKLDATGTIEWQKSYGGSGIDIANSIKSTSDGGYIVAGLTQSNDGDVTVNYGFSDYWIVKLNSIGNILWQKSFGGSKSDVANSIQITPDGGYVVAGGTRSNNGDVTGNHGSYYDYWVLKLDAIGDLQWQKCFGGSSEDHAYNIQLTLDGGYILVGQSFYNGGDVTGNNGAYDYWVVKLDTNGVLQWQKSLGGSSYDIAYHIKPTTDGGYVITGYTESNNGDVTGYHGSQDAWVVKIDAIGNIQWQKSLGGSSYDVAYATQNTSDGGYIVASSSNSNDGDVSGNHGIGDIWIVKLNSVGSIQWQKSMGGSGSESANAIQTTADGGYIVAGSTDSTDGDVTGNHGGVDFWVVKLAPDALGTSTYNKDNIIIYPNPVQNVLQIQSATLAQISKVKIIDVQGKIVLEQTQNTNTINVETLAKGIYLLETYSGNEKQISKFIKE